MKRLLLTVMLGCGGGAPAAPDTAPSAAATNDPFADADWRFLDYLHTFSPRGEASLMGGAEVTCQLRASTLDCDDDDAFFEGVWVRDGAGYRHDGKPLTGAPDGDRWCASETREDGGVTWTTTICIAADGIDEARQVRTEANGEQLEHRFERDR